MHLAKTAYLFVDTKISDPAAFKYYKSAEPLIKKFGDTYLTLGEKMDIVLHELCNPTWIVQSTDAIQHFLDSPECAPVKDKRLSKSKATKLILESL